MENGAYRPEMAPNVQQVTFKPFLLDEQPDWNPNPGYTILFEAMIRR
jgi:hypothetical protein